MSKPGKYSRKAKGLFGSMHPQWKDSVHYVNLHKWVKRELGSPRLCVHCGNTKAKAYHWANKSREYKRDLNDWLRLCVSCHSHYDGGKRRGCAKTSSQYTGVYWDKERKRWASELNSRGRKFHLGRFKSEEDAAIYYDVAVQIITPPGSYINGI